MHEAQQQFRVMDSYQLGFWRKSTISSQWYWYLDSCLTTGDWSHWLGRPDLSLLYEVLPHPHKGSHVPMHGYQHWGRDKMVAVSQTMFSNAFSWMKMYEFRLKFQWSLFLRFQLIIFTHWFRYWLGAVQATSHYLNQWWLVYWRIYASLGLNELTWGLASIYIVHHGRVGSVGLCDLKILHPWRRLKKGVKILQWPPPPPPPPARKRGQYSTSVWKVYKKRGSKFYKSENGCQNSTCWKIGVKILQCLKKGDQYSTHTPHPTPPHPTPPSPPPPR